MVFLLGLAEALFLQSFPSFENSKSQDSSHKRIINMVSAPKYCLNNEFTVILKHQEIGLLYSNKENQNLPFRVGKYLKD